MDDTELKDLKPNPQHDNHQQPEPEPTLDEASNLPLLKRGSLSSSDDHHHHPNPPPPHPPSKPPPPPPTTTAVELEEMEKKFAAYVRHDVYGPMGLGKLPITEKLLLAIAIVTLVPLRVLFGMTILVLYYLICKVCTVYSTPNRLENEGEGAQQRQEQEDYSHLGGWRRKVIVTTGRFLARALLFTFGFYWIPETYLGKLSDKSECGDEMEEEPVRPGAVVSNHVSYLDILYHMSSSFPSFVAKRSVGKLPLVGLISKCLGCVYVQREDKSSDFKGVSGVVTERIKDAHENRDAPMMLIFPEGTTTNGDFLLPFKTGAFIAGAPVLPVILRYPYQRFSPAWDSISGVRHVILLLCQFVNYVEVTKLPIYYPSKEEKDDPKLYASNVRKLMATEGNLILSDIGLPEKRIYHAALNGNNSLHSVPRPKTD